MKLTSIDKYATLTALERFVWFYSGSDEQAAAELNRPVKEIVAAYNRALKKLEIV